ncbi:MAG TPA: hypothetical protein VGO26_11820 [Amnibacterium sp.]|nr:hypothetical protein [Amnibacterium sp.]
MSGFDVAVRRLRVQRVRRLLLIIGVLVLALGGVALLPQGQHRGTFRVATSDRNAGHGPTGVVQGRVTATRSGDRVCFSVAAAQGRVLLVLPRGWSADDRLRLLDDAGQALVPPGAVMAFLGAPGSIGTVAGCTGEGRIWYVTDVRLPSRSG